MRKPVSVLTVGALTAALAAGSVSSGGITAEAADSDTLTQEILEQLAEPDEEYQPGIRMATQNGYDGDDEDMLDIVEEEVREAYENGLSSIEVQTNGSVGTSDYIETLIRYYELGNELGIAIELRVGGAGSVQGGSPQGIYYAETELTDGAVSNGLTLSGTNTIAASQTFTDSLQSVIAVQYETDEDGNKVQTDVHVFDTSDFTYTSEDSSLEDEDTSNDDGRGGFGASSTEETEVTITYNGSDVDLGDGTWSLLAFYNGYDPNGSGMDNTDFYSQASTEVIIANTLSNLGQDSEDADLKARSDYLISLMAENGQYGGLFAVDGGDSNQILSDITWSSEIFEKCEELYGYDFQESMAVQYAGYTFSTDLENQQMRNDWKEIMSYLCQDYYTTLEEWAQEEFNSGFRAQIGFATELDTGVTTTTISIADTESYWPSSGGTDYNFDVTTAYSQVTSGSHLLRRSITSNVELGAINGAHGAGFVDWLVGNVNKAFYGGANNMLYHVYESQAGNYFGYGYDGTMQSFGNSNPQYTAMDEINDYVARVQYVMQNGTASRDIAIYEQVYDATSTDLDIYEVDDSIEEAGYTYDILNPGYMDLDNCYAEDGVIDPEGGSYKALVVYQPLTVDVLEETKSTSAWTGETTYGEQESYLDGQYISVSTAEKFLEYAEAGVPIIVVGDYTEFHAASSGETDEELHAIFEQIDALGMLYTASDETQVVAALEEAGVESDVQKDESSRIVSWKQSFSAASEGVDADFYWLYNYQQGDGTDYTEGESVTQTISLAGTGTLYEVDLWSGEVTEVENYTSANGYISFEITLEAYDTAMYVIVAGDETSAVTEESEEAETIELTSFTLTVESWTSGYGYTDGKASVDDEIIKEDLQSVEITDLTTQTWDTLTFYDADGNEIAGETVSGVGKYETTFTLDTYSEVSLDIGEYYDTVVLYVNGDEVPVNMIDASDVDITDYVQSGENTIVIEAASDLQNICIAEGTANSSSDSVQSYGLYGNDGVVTLSVTPAAETEEDGTADDESDEGTSGSDTSDDTSEEDGTADVENEGDGTADDSSSGTDNTSDSSSSVKTGDTNTMAAVILVMSAAAAAVGITLMRRRKLYS